VSDSQLYLTIGVPIIVNVLVNGTVAIFIRVLLLDELRRVEEVLDARLKHLEERA
jgi:hypothetical protein